MSQPLPTAQRYNTWRNRWAFPRMADNCTLPMISGTPSLSYKVLALFDMLPRAPITIDITVTFEVPWILLISNARSWYFSTFSSSVLMMFWSAGTAMSIRVHFCVSLCTRVISGRLCFNTCLCRSQVTRTSPFSATGKGWINPCQLQKMEKYESPGTYTVLMVIPFVSTPYPLLPKHLLRYPRAHLGVALPILTLGKLLVSTNNVPHCFSGFSTQSTQWCLWGLIYAVLKACSSGASIKPSVSFFKNPFLSHLKDSSPATSDVCWTNSPCKAFFFLLLTFFSFILLS